MNLATSHRPTANRHLHRRLTATLVSACAVGLLGSGLSVARAADVAAPESVVVKYSDLDVATHEGALELSRRIAAAAHRVCPDADTPSLAAKMASWSCRRQAIDRAVESVNSPQVATLLKNERVASNR